MTIIKRKLFKYVFILFVIVAAVAGYLIYRYKLNYHFKVVVPHTLYRSGTLSKKGLASVYKLSHFKTIVVLRSNLEVKQNTQNWYGIEKQFAKQHGAKQIVISAYADIPPTPSQIKHFLKIVLNPNRQPVLVHCANGVVRTGMMIAAYRLIVLRQSKQFVLNTLPLWHHPLSHHPEMKTFIMRLKPNQYYKLGY